MKKKYVWVCKDLSNKDGQNYVWYFLTREEGRKAKKYHNEWDLAELSWPIKMEWDEFVTKYRPIPVQHKRFTGWYWEVK